MYKFSDIVPMLRIDKTSLELVFYNIFSNINVLENFLAFVFYLIKNNRPIFVSYYFSKFQKNILLNCTLFTAVILLNITIQ